MEIFLTQNEEIDEELVIKLSLWEKKNRSLTQRLIKPSELGGEREKRGIERKSYLIMDFQCYKLYHCTVGPMVVFANGVLISVSGQWNEGHLQQYWLKTGPELLAVG